MAVNPFFLHGSESEQRLIQQLVNEQLSMYGLDVSYIPQTFVRKETILEEVSSSQFTDQFTIEAYLGNYDGYSGSGDILSKFGMQLKDEVTLIISKERFEDFIAPFLLSGGQDVHHRPREGDLIYFPLGRRLFEIKFVEHEQPFYQLGKTYVYELKCELFEYSDRSIIDTTVDSIDETLEDFGIIKTLELYTSGVGATASSVLNSSSGYVSTINLINDGYNYSTSPSIVIDSPPSGVAAAATATVSVGGSVTDTAITSGGYYPSYVTAPLVTFSDPTGGGNETDTVKFGSRAYDGGDSGTLISTTGLSASDEGAVEFWFYVAEAPANGTTRTIARWGSNDAGNEQYRLDIQTLNGDNQIFYHRPNSDTTAGTSAIAVTTTASGDIGRWNWIRLSQASSGFNQVAVHYMGASGTFQSSYSSQTFHTQIYNGDGFNLNADGDFSDGQVFVDELRFTSDGSNTQPTLPTSTSKNLANTVFFQDGERVTATGTAVLNTNDVVTGITLTSGGQNYTSAPTVTIADPEPSIRATAVAISSCANNNCSVRNVYITNSGAGYTSIPNVLISDTTGIGATATAEINTSYSGIGTITVYGGSGYTSAPNVVFDAPASGTRATGIAIIDASGSVSSIYISNAGDGYTSAPGITIDAPSTITGSGTFIFNEVLTGETSGTTSRVKSWDPTNSILEVKSVSGDYLVGEVLKGATSGARYTLGKFNDPVYEDKYEQNDEIQTASTSILDFTETNLFGNY